jgi:predicted RNA-binding protein Jag
MEELKQKIEKMLELGGFDFSVDIDGDSSRVNIFIRDEEVKNNLPKLVLDLEHIVKVMAKKLQIEKVNVDVNNYKKERERLISELAKAAARKVLLEKKEVELPAMNAYERRIVHVELATRPDVKTESVGEDSSRHIVVKPTEL